MKEEFSHELVLVKRVKIDGKLAVEVNETIVSKKVTNNFELQEQISELYSQLIHLCRYEAIEKKLHYDRTYGGSKVD